MGNPRTPYLNKALSSLLNMDRSGATRESIDVELSKINHTLSEDDIALLRRVDEFLAKPPEERLGRTPVDIKKLVEQKEADDRESAYELFRYEFMSFAFDIMKAKDEGEREKVFEATVSRIQTGLFLEKDHVERIKYSWYELMSAFQCHVGKTLAGYQNKGTKDDLCIYMQRLQAKLDPRGKPFFLCSPQPYEEMMRGAPLQDDEKIAV